MYIRRLAVTVLCLLMIAPVLSPLFATTADLTDPGSLTSRGPIAISADGQFTGANGVVAGAGSMASPYIIENWSIDATSTHGIYIQDTTAHFIIRNCKIFNGTNQSGVNDGIYLSNVDNGDLENNRIYDSYFSITLAGSHNIDLRNNTAYGSIIGIYLWDTDNSTVHNNTVHNTTGSGISIYSDSYDNNISHNIVMDNPESGIRCKGCRWNTIDNNTIYNTTDNGLWMDEASNNTVRDNDIYDNSRYGIFIDHGSLRNRYYGNEVHNNTESGFYLNDTTQNDIYENTVYNNTDLGVFINNSYNNTFSDNDLAGNRFNLGFYGPTVDEYNNTINKNNTVDDKPVHYLVKESGKTVPSDAGFVGLIECDDILVENTTISKNQYGIMLHSTTNSILNNNTVSLTTSGIMFLELDDDNMVSNNTLYDNTMYGIGLFDSQDDIIFNNTIYDNDRGIHLTEDSDNTMVDHNTVYNNTYAGLAASSFVDLGIHNNTFYENGYGIHVQGIEGVTVAHNTIRDNDDHGLYKAVNDGKARIHSNTVRDNLGTGIYLTNSDNNTVNLNRVYDNGIYGITLDQAYDNLVYDNYFNNTDNYDVTGGSGNRWNTSKTGNKNVMGGPSQGGNWWSNYTGTDTDGDGIGDTQVPYGPGDELPLLADLVTPGVSDNTTSLPTTGDPFSFNASVWDDLHVSNVSVEYWFEQVDGPSAHANLTMDRYSGDSVDGEYNITIQISSNALVLRYSMAANDSYDNWNVSDIHVLQVGDNDGPQVTDNTPTTPSISDDLTFNVSVVDNIKVEIVNVTFWFDNGTRANLTMEEMDGYYVNNTTIPSNATTLRYIISASDNSSNWALGDQVDRAIRDDIIPSVQDLSGIPRTGEAFKFVCTADDNFEIDRVTVEYWYGTGTHKTGALVSNGSYELEVVVPITAKVLHYMIRAYDASNNLAITSNDVDVVDTVRPTITDHSIRPTTGDPMVISLTIEDNWAVTEAYLEHWTDSGAHTNLSYTSEIVLNVSDPAKAVDYIVTAMDETGNTRTLTVHWDVLDNDLPTVQDQSGTPTTGDGFTFVVAMEDNVGITMGYIEYRFDDGETVNISYSAPYLIMVPEKAFVLHYVVSVYDDAGNKAGLTKAKDIGDNDPPSITDLTGTPTTGGDLVIRAEALDNIGLYEVTVKYWFDSGSLQLKVMSFDNGQYIFFIRVPENANILYYTLEARDSNDNLASVNISKDVDDTIAPEILDSTLTPTTGDDLILDLKTTDNQGVAEVTVEYWFDNGTHSTKAYITGMIVGVPTNALVFYMKVKAKDDAGNEKEANFEKAVRDNDLPVLEDLTKGTPEAGKRFTFKASAEDNVGIARMLVEYWYSDGGRESAIMERQGEVYVAEIEVENDAELHYIIRGTDAAGNNQGTQEKVLSVSRLFGGTSMMLVSLILLMLVMIVLGAVGWFVMDRKRRRREEAVAKRKAGKKAASTKTKEPSKPKVDHVWKAIPTKKDQEEPVLEPVIGEDEEAIEEAEAPKEVKKKKDIWGGKKKDTVADAEPGEEEGPEPDEDEDLEPEEEGPEPDEDEDLEPEDEEPEADEDEDLEPEEEGPEPDEDLETELDDEEEVGPGSEEKEVSKPEDKPKSKDDEDIWNEIDSILGEE